MNEPPSAASSGTPSSDIILQSASTPASNSTSTNSNRVFRVLRAPKSQIALRQRHKNEQAHAAARQQKLPQMPEVAKKRSVTPPQELRSNEVPDMATADMLSSMVESYLNVNGDIKEPTRKRRHVTGPDKIPQVTNQPSKPDDSMDIDEYVYDIYYRESHAQPHKPDGLVGLM